MHRRSIRWKTLALLLALSIVLGAPRAASPGPRTASDYQRTPRGDILTVDGARVYWLRRDSRVLYVRVGYPLVIGNLDQRLAAEILARELNEAAEAAVRTAGIHGAQMEASVRDERLEFRGNFVLPAAVRAVMEEFAVRMPSLMSDRQVIRRAISQYSEEFAQAAQDPVFNVLYRLNLALTRVNVSHRASQSSEQDLLLAGCTLLEAPAGMSVVGPVDREEAVQLASIILRGLWPTVCTQSSKGKGRDSDKSRRRSDDRTFASSAILPHSNPNRRRSHDMSPLVVAVGLRCGGYLDKDYHALRLAVEILGGGGSNSRLIRDLRIRRGLVYSMATRLEARGQISTLSVLTTTSKADAHRVIDRISRALRLLRNTPPSDDEIRRAVDALVNEFDLSTGDGQTVALSTFNSAMYGLGPEWIAAYPARIASVSPLEVSAALSRCQWPQVSTSASKP